MPYPNFWQFSLAQVAHFPKKSARIVNTKHNFLPHRCKAVNKLSKKCCLSWEFWQRVNTSSN
jgi:hypothetical protein